MSVCEIMPSGTTASSVLLVSLQCDGARYREFLSRGTSIKAGEINRYEFTMLQFFLRRIDKGSRLRLVLTSPNPTNFQRTTIKAGL